MDREQTVVITIEPSKRFSEICGFPYFIERRFSVGELLDNKMITEGDIDEMATGKQICRQWKANNG